MTLREAGLPSQATQEFRRILRAHSGMLDSQIQLGLTYYSMGRTPEAIAEWEAVLEKDPSRDEARMYLRLVRGAARRLSAAVSPDMAKVANVAETVGIGPLDEIEISGWSTSVLATGHGEPSR
jgi:tetratricopeptide (TPR) repeat protein